MAPTEPDGINRVTVSCTLDWPPAPFNYNLLSSSQYMTKVPLYGGYPGGMLLCPNPGNI